MTWFSLKRTLQLHLASSIEILNQINQGVAKSNLYTPPRNLHTLLRYSTVLPSIGKTTQICHQNIPLKKVNCNRTVTYFSAIPRKLENLWQCSGDDIADMITIVLKAQDSKAVWSNIQKNNNYLEFVISQQGMEQWQQKLHQWVPSSIARGSPWPVEPDELWQLQSGYELCCRWQRYFPINHSSQATISSKAAFPMPDTPWQDLIHCLLDICDSWEQAQSSQLLQQVKQLVFTLQKCIAMIRLFPAASPAADIVANWLEATRIVLQQSLGGRLGYHVTTQL